MPRRPEIGNVQLYPNRPLKPTDKNGYVLKFYCPLRCTRVRKNCGTRNRREARRIQRECQERLLNGDYVASGGEITRARAIARGRHVVPSASGPPRSGKTWQECYERFKEHRQTRIRESSLVHALSRLNIAERIFEGYREDHGLPEGLLVSEVMTLDMLEYLQDRLLAGDECRYDVRSPNTVNSMLKAVMTFVRFCHARDWIDRVPQVPMLDVEDVMKGRPITGEEFDRMIEVTPAVVGSEAAPQWQFALRVLWESGFRVGDLMDFSWDDDRHIHPVWPSRPGQHPTIIVPASQKNGRLQEIPMLPGLIELLSSVPETERMGWIVNPGPMGYEIKAKGDWFRPDDADLQGLVERFSNRALAAACNVTDTSVRNWLKQTGVERPADAPVQNGRMSAEEVAALRAKAQRRSSHSAQRSTRRLTKERVSRIVAMIGKEAGIVVRKADSRTGRRRKFGSAHDLRRGCAQRLINAGISAESLKVIMRHKDFATTERHYGAIRSAQAAATEVAEKLNSAAFPSIDGGIGGGKEKPPQLSAEEVVKLKSLINSL